MKARIFVLTSLIFVLWNVATEAQDKTKPSTNSNADISVSERELRQFYDGYADDLRAHRGEAIANRYDSRGYFALGNGSKRLVSFDDNKKHYMTRWTGPKAFEWRDLSFEVLSPNSAAVAGVFDWTNSSGVKDTLSYTAVLTKQSGQWRIRVEDESSNSIGISTNVISGDPSTPGPFKYSVTARAGSSLGAHRHPNDVKITIKSGRMFVLMGDLETAKVQRFEAGSTFVIPAKTWHVEWWEDSTVAEAETTAPTSTERATPATPRVP